MKPPNLSAWKSFLSSPEEKQIDPYEDFSERSQFLAEKLNNFTLHTDDDYADPKISFTLDESIKMGRISSGEELQEILDSVYRQPSVNVPSFSELGLGSVYITNPDLNKECFRRLQAENLELKGYMDQRYDLPISSLSSSTIDKLSVPAAISFFLRKAPSTGQIHGQIMIFMRPGESEEEIATSFGMVEHLDEKLKEVKRVFTSVVSDAIKDYKKNKKEKEEEAEPLSEERGRSRQRGIYKFYLMIGYSTIATEIAQRGLDDILTDIRALPNVTICTVIVGNRRVGDGRYVAGLSLKFCPTTPGSIGNPRDVKKQIVLGVRNIRNVQNVFRVSADIERIE